MENIDKHRTLLHNTVRRDMPPDVKHTARELVRHFSQVLQNITASSDISVKIVTIPWQMSRK